ncbi:thiamine phosphate synthase [Derxia lacustris]|uniref:thiamine phosphate synthase n=1 Tax=Derxia lacustris TaxID=764842 RepID=UPI0038B375A9
MAARRALRGLYAITPEDLRGPALVTATAAAVAGGAALVQYRAKHDDAAQRLADAHALAAACRHAGALFFVNDDAELALAVGADGVHLGRDDGPIAALRAAQPRLLIGASCYAEPERARAAAAAGADYLAFGAVFPSPTKPAAVRAPLALFDEARALGLPLVAIGGITLVNAGEVIAAGADALAVVTDLFRAPDIAARASQYAQLWR